MDESERALAVVQARLLEALKGNADQEADAAAAKHAAEQERLRLETEVGVCLGEGGRCVEECLCEERYQSGEICSF